MEFGPSDGIADPDPAPSARLRILVGSSDSADEGAEDGAQLDAPFGSTVVKCAAAGIALAATGETSADSCEALDRIACAAEDGDVLPGAVSSRTGG